MTADPARRAAEALRRHGLAAPARLLADAHRPVAPLLGDLGTAFGPLLGAIGGARGSRLERALADERSLDALIVELDALEDRDARPG